MSENCLPPKLRLVSYNIRKAVGLDYRRNPGRIIDVLNDLNADVIALQEVDRRLGDRPTVLDAALLERMEGYEPVALAHNSVSLGWHGNAILVRKGLQVCHTARIPLPGLEPRGAVRVDIGSGRDRLAIIGTHLGLLRPYRRHQLGAILASIDAAHAGRSVILGDFNEWAANKGLEPLMPHFRVISPGKSYPSAYPLAGLDRIALGREVGLVGSGVERRGKSRFSSDHLPIWADITLKPPSKA